MSDSRLTVIVVSRHRPAALMRCISALRQQIGVQIELVVVADPSAMAQVRAADLKTAEFDEANIAAARNIGLDLSASEVVAFIDDDAVAEPTWARRLLAAFAWPDVVAATGFVRGRNGISYQWRASEIDAEGQDHPLDIPDDQGIHFPCPAPGRAIKTPGTNCAFRTRLLREIGGFSGDYRFYLDESDVNLRLRDHGRTAIVPAAQVHHRFHASARRRQDRAPLDLFEIGASTAVFLRRHAPTRLDPALSKLRAAQRDRLMSMMIDGRIEPRDLRRLLGTLEAGVEDGCRRHLDALPARSVRDHRFLALDRSTTGSGCFLVGWSWHSRALAAKARAEVAAGRITTLLCLSPGFRRHRVLFDDAGFWLQRGGLWGRVARDRPPLWHGSLRERSAVLKAETAAFRPID